MLIILRLPMDVPAWPPFWYGHNDILLFSAPLPPHPGCRISPPHFLAECRKRRLNQGSLFCFRFAVRLGSSNIFCQAAGCVDRLRNDLDWRVWVIVKLQSSLAHFCEVESQQVCHTSFNCSRPWRRAEHWVFGGSEMEASCALVNLLVF